MPYNYQEMRSYILESDSGKNKILETESKVHSLPKRFTAQQAFTTGDSWTMLACIDYLVEKGIIREIEPDGPFEQHRQFVKVGI
ncbi:hypothetical protein PBI_SCTP2_496 [Salicola phage SCTP-2]|nr:hypothetical protein PBI_SCTP2_496 [Salicola phage SCTP-2]